MYNVDLLFIFIFFGECLAGETVASDKANKICEISFAANCTVREGRVCSELCRSKAQPGWSLINGYCDVDYAKKTRCICDFDCP